MRNYIKYTLMGVIMLVELYGTTICGWLYSVGKSLWTLIILIVSCSITFISSLVFTCTFVKDKKDKEREITKIRKNCPYYIEKYDDLENPEYIDKEIL